MKKPATPPKWRDILHDLPEDEHRFQHLISGSIPIDRRYLHWDQLRRLSPPEDLTHREWWLVLKMHRNRQFKDLPLRDRQGNPFQYLITDPIPEHLHRIDLSAGGRMDMPDQVTNPETRDHYYVASLIEEAITSSQLEGATTTRQIAKEMIRTGRFPQNRSEHMILNNYRAMKAMETFKNQPLTPDLIFELHRLVTKDTLDEPSAVGRLRREDETIYVTDRITGDVLHRPPPAEELPSRLQTMCTFANDQTSETFIHPVLRAIILHFWLAYDHPFVDGNGRTARALFYWSLLRNGYWLFEFLSISHILRQAPIQYSRAFLYTETDDNDLTYFILHQLRVINQATRALQAYIHRKTQQIQQVEQQLKTMADLNHRQRALLSHALRHPDFRYTIYGHQNSHNIVYQTARTDLLDLQKRGLLTGAKSGKQWIFTPSKDLPQKLTT